MSDSKRRVGIDIIGEAAWGTHLCLFYQTQQQLTEILAPYFLAGVENNEYCVWMVAEPLTVKTAGQGLRKEMKHLVPYLKRGQIVILDRRPWLLHNGKFNPDAMLQSWAEMERQALDKGFDGLRICGDMGWVEEEDWETITYYEGLFDRETGQQRILALCAYSQEKCGTAKVFDLISNHQLGLIQRAGKWEAITSSDYDQVKQALKASEDRYQALVRSSLHHMFMLNREGVYIESNDWVDQFGLKSGEALIGLSLNDVYPPELTEAYAQQLERVLATGLAVEFEHPMSMPDGEHEYLVTLYPIYRYGEIEAVGGISRDITDSKRAEKAIRLAEERYHSIYENAVEGIFQSTPGGRYLNVNPAMARIFGYASPEDMITTIGENIESRIHANPGRRADFMNALLADGVVKEFENQNYRKDGNIIWTHTNARAVRDGKGELLYFEGFLTDITERKRAEEALRLDSQMMANMVNGVCLVKSSDSTIVYTNPQFENMFGYGPGEMIGKPISCVNAPTDRSPQEVAVEIMEELNKNGVWGGEIFNLKKDGTPFWGLARVSSFTHSTYGPVWISVHQDITERKRAEQALRESEQRFHSLFDNATIGQYRTTPDGRILLANPAIVQMLGFGSFEEMASRNLEQDGFEPEYQRDQFRQLIETEGAVKGLEAIWNRKDGEQIYVRESAKAVRDDSGKVIYYEGTVEDITERKHAEEALLESEIRFRTLANVAPAGVYLTDGQGNCQYANPRWCQMVGLELEEALGKGWAKRVHPEDIGWLVEEMIENRDRKEEWNYEYRFLTPDGKVTWVSGVEAPIFDQSGRNPNQAIGYVGVGLDITERKQMETQLRAALAEKEVLLREVHHRVKNNLATISSLLELQARASQDARVQSAFQESQQRIRSMTQIHEQLYLSKSLTHIDMSQYVAGLADELRYVYTKGEVAVQVDVQQVKLTIDQAIPCGLIINELVTNALKYAFPAHQAVEGSSDPALHRHGNQLVSVLMHSAGDQCLLKVSDNGVGLPEGMDIQSTKRLGLRLVSRLALQLGGELIIESGPQQPGGGADFQIVFPVKR
jgi:PAS domain S-box-containing protein